ncbi:MAG: PTS sugar transporter subunit IIA [Candidatus Zixiibacteriota bacterium]
MGINISKFMAEDLIDLNFQVEQEPPPEEGNSNKWRERNKERILSSLVSLLDKSGQTCNKSKLLNDFIFRERKATTALGLGIAVPHIRTMQAREFVIGFARSIEGYDFGSPDKLLTHMFFIMAAPPYDDSLYLKVFKSLSENLQYEYFREELMNARIPFDIIRAFKNVE